MMWTASQIAVFSIGVVHAGFMIGELYPWENPWIMVLVLKKWCGSPEPDRRLR